MLEIITDTLVDSIRLLPFLFITYLLMEYMEHRMSQKARTVVKKAGRFGPLYGGLMGIFPQCGFSASASGLYAGRVITIGTLMAIFLSTSDEMLPILISAQMNVSLILQILLLKVVIAVLAGLIVDFVFARGRNKPQADQEIGRMCEHDHCRCEGGVLVSALRHTLQIFIFIILISLALNAVIFYIGEDFLSNLILNKPGLGHMIAGLVGMIPNCASSILITRLYLDGLMTLGTMLSGLLAGTGVGLLVLYRVNSNWKENIRITLMLYALGVIGGILIDIYRI